jgi:hypothetical protein
MDMGEWTGDGDGNGNRKMGLDYEGGSFPRADSSHRENNLRISGKRRTYPRVCLFSARDKILIIILVIVISLVIILFFVGLIAFLQIASIYI